MKLSAWAKKTGISYQTAWNWFSAGKLPVRATQTATGTILVHGDELAPGKAVAVYARVSSHDQRADLDRQVARLCEFAALKGFVVSQVASEVGSGLNGARPKLLKVLRDREAAVVLVEHRERLCRFGFEYLEAALAAQGRSILVMDPCEVSDDLVRDMTEVLTSFCARLYGRRGAKRKALAAMNSTRPEAA